MAAAGRWAFLKKRLGGRWGGSKFNGEGVGEETIIKHIILSRFNTPFPPEICPTTPSVLPLFSLVVSFLLSWCRSSPCWDSLFPLYHFPFSLFYSFSPHPNNDEKEKIFFLPFLISFSLFFSLSLVGILPHWYFWAWVEMEFSRFNARRENIKNLFLKKTSHAKKKSKKISLEKI